MGVRSDVSLSGFNANLRLFTTLDTLFELHAFPSKFRLRYGMSQDFEGIICINKVETKIMETSLRSQPRIIDNPELGPVEFICDAHNCRNLMISGILCQALLFPFVLL